MKISVWWSGKTKAPFEVIVDNYLTRIDRLHSISIKVFETKRGLQPDQQQKHEGQLMLKSIRKGDRIYLLDEKGVGYSSTKFAEFLGTQQMIGRHLIFIIGGPYGFSNVLRNRSEGIISLSKMTFTHDMVRIIFLEQLYRAFSIQQNLPYHHS